MTRETYNNGEWSKARFNSFIKSILRNGSLRWGPRYKCLSDAFTGSQINAKTNRLAKHYKCAECLQAFPGKDVRVDHIEPIIDPAVGFTNWDDVVNALFCEADNLQTLCVSCHHSKTQQEKQIAKERKNGRK